MFGKVLGLVTGYALDGVPGAVVGILAGHMVDMYITWASVKATKARKAAGPRGPRTDGEDRRNAGARYNFTLCVVSLGAKLAKVDGPVTPAEVAAFKEVFRVPAEELHNVTLMFNRARTTPRGFEAFAEQLAVMFDNERSTLNEVVNCLFHVALADGGLSALEVDFIRKVSKIFGFSDSYFQRRMEEQVASHPNGGYAGNGFASGSRQQSNGRGQYSQNGQQGQSSQQTRRTTDDPYAILGVAASTSDKDIKLRYRKLVRENHPDGMVAAGKSKTVVEQATAKLARINAAYDQILKERQL